MCPFSVRLLSVSGWRHMAAELSCRFTRGDYFDTGIKDDYVDVWSQHSVFDLFLRHPYAEAIKGLLDDAAGRFCMPGRVIARPTIARMESLRRPPKDGIALVQCWLFG